MNPLDFITTTNYPSSLLENTFGNQYFKNVVEPTKAAIQSGSQVTKPALGQLIKNWNPLKAVFTPQMLKTGPTLAAKTFLKGTGVGTFASLLSPTHLGADDMPTGDAEQQYFDYYNQYGDNYGDLKIPGSNWRQRLMNQKIQQQKKMIGMPQHLTRTPPANVPTPTPKYSGPITYDFDPKQDTGRRPDKPGGFTDPGKGSYGPHMAYGGRVSYFDGGLASLWLR